MVFKNSFLMATQLICIVWLNPFFASPQTVLSYKYSKTNFLLSLLVYGLLVPTTNYYSPLLFISLYKIAPRCVLCYVHYTTNLAVLVYFSLTVPDHDLKHVNLLLFLQYTFAVYKPMWMSNFKCLNGGLTLRKGGLFVSNPKARMGECDLRRLN